MMYNDIDSVTAVCDELAFVATDVLALGSLAGTYLHSADDAITPGFSDEAVAEYIVRNSEHLHDKIKTLSQALYEINRKAKGLPIDPDAEEEQDQAEEAD